MTTTKARTPNRALRAERIQRDWSLDRTAIELERIALEHELPDSRGSLRQQYRRIESGETRQPGLNYQHAISRLFQRPRQELFGACAPTVNAPAAVDQCEVISHKFIQAYAGPTSVPALVERYSLSYDSARDRYSGSIEHPTGTCVMYAYPFGAIVCHLEERRHWASLADLSVWRRESYPTALAWLTRQLQNASINVTSNMSGESYVLSVYWVCGASWTGDELETAMRILCMPSVLIPQRSEADRNRLLGQAELAERSMLSEGLHASDLHPFGRSGAAIAYASWSGVSYCPLDDGRALSQGDLVEVELEVQALWTYCRSIIRTVADGQQPLPADGYGWRFLRGAHARLTNPSPRETSQVKAMRAAIVETSNIASQLTGAISELRDA